MSYTGQPRASMAVNPSNTNSLLAKFEAMKKTVAANQTTNAQQPARSPQPTTTASRPPGTTTTSTYSTPAKAATNPVNQRGNSGIGQTGGIKASTAPVAKQPTQSKAPGPSKFSQFNTPDEDTRAAPLQKPKPDQHRMTMAVDKPEQLQQKLQQMAVNEKKPTVSMPSPSVQSINNTISSSMNGDFQVGEKWKINYDDLEFDQLVSSGSAGEVFLGYFFGTPVAIKKLFALAADQRHLVAREFAMLQGVNHPNIVQFLGICDHSTGIYLITEYVEHGDLFDLLVFGEQDIGWRAKVRISAQVAAAVFYLHSRGIIHRDLKSQNVLIGENYKVKLCDLGLATQVENRKRMTVCGTDEWMAPEIVLEETYDLKVDVFSFGVVITEMVTNQPPKKRDFANKLAFDEQAFRDSAPSDCPPEFIKIAIDCCRFRPQDRPSFRDIVPRLKKLSDSLE